MEKDWPLSTEELQLARAMLIERISFVEIVQKYSSKIEEVNSPSFTHKCTCPNPNHKNGQEKTPSFHFSEKSGRFICFSCGINGNVFDLIALMEGTPWYKVVRDLLRYESIDLNKIDLYSFKNKSIATYDYLYEINLDLSTKLRDHLAHFKDTKKWFKERDWVDSMFRRIDNRIEKLSDEDLGQAYAFYCQILSEIDRRFQLLDER